MGRVVIPGFRKIETSGGGEGGTTNYEDLTNKPSINNVPLVGNVSTVNLKLTDSTLTEEGVPAEAKTVGTKLEEQSTSLTVLSRQLGSHTVKSDVPENAVFTDTLYDDTEVKEKIDEINNNLDKYVLNSDDKFIGGSGQTEYLNIDFSNYDNGIYYIYGKSTDNKILATAHVAVEDFVVSIIDRSNPSIVSNGSTLTFYTTSWWIDVYVKKINVDNGYIGSNIAGIKESLYTLQFGEVAGGKNLLNPVWSTSSNSGVDFINNGDGSFTIKGTHTQNESSFNESILIQVEVGKSYKLIGNCIAVYKKDNKTYIVSNGILTSESVFTATEDAVNICLYVPGQISNVDITTKYMLIEATDSTDYEPYFPSNKMLAEDVDSIKNDLDKLNALPIGTIIQIEADKDTIATTEAKYSWQYLGTSNIQYENGSSTLLATNDYRKNN